MSIVDVPNLDAGEPLPGWHDRYFQSETMSFAYYDVDQGAAIHEHFHPEEEVWHIVAGSLEFTVAGETFVAAAGTAAVIPPDAPHLVKALTDARVIIANHPVRPRVVQHSAQTQRPMGFVNTESTTAAQWYSLRSRLDSLIDSVADEIRAYPTPITACDAQFNHLLHLRATLPAERDRVDDVAQNGSMSIEEFVRCSPCAAALAPLLAEIQQAPASDE